MLKANEIVRVLKACAEAGVSEVEVGGLKAKFLPKALETSKVELGQLKLPVGYTEVDTEATDEQVSKALVHENIVAAEDQLDLMQIQDPAAYEQLILERQLEDNAREASH